MDRQAEQAVRERAGHLQQGLPRPLAQPGPRGRWEDCRGGQEALRDAGRGRQQDRKWRSALAQLQENWWQQQGLQQLHG